MASRLPTFALLLLLAACATTAPKTTPSSDANAPTYLQGLSSKYSIRLDEVDSRGSQARAKQLPHGLAAGDESVTLCAALYRQDDTFGLDLVIQNHDLEAFELYRANIVLRDDTGRWLKPSEPFVGAQRAGLRGLSSAKLAQGSVPGATTALEPTPTASIPAGGSSLQGMKGVGPPVETSRRPTLGLTPSVEVADRDPVLPEILQVEPGKSRVYWSYWSGSQLDYPLYVTISVNSRRLLFKFDEPVTE